MKTRLLTMLRNRLFIVPFLRKYEVFMTDWKGDVKTCECRKTKAEAEDAGRRMILDEVSKIRGIYGKKR